LWQAPEPVVFEGKHLRLNGAICSPGPVGNGPRFYLGGASDQALALAGRQADVYLAWIEPLPRMAQHLQRARAEFAASGRPPSFGLRTHLVVRDTEAEAWGATDKLLSQAEEVVKNQRKAVFANSPMVGQRAQAQVVPKHRLGPHLWNGISTVRVNCGTAIVGTPDQVAQELLGYWRLGIDEFILSGFPHVEECRRVASDLLPMAKSLIEADRSA
jgi:alkanesulfonate monooxygenase